MHDAAGIAVVLLLVICAMAAGQYLHIKHVFWLPECGATILIGVAAGLLIDVLSHHHPSR